MIDRWIEKFDRLYYNKTFKVLYTSIGAGISIALFLIVPIIFKREFVKFSTWFSLLIRIFITYSFGSMFYYASHLDETHQRFFKGADTQSFSKPDGLKQGVNILAGIGAGTLFFFYYRACLQFFLPILGIGSTIISIVMGVCVSIPLISQHKKR
jgi:hypothetical protein